MIKDLIRETEIRMQKSLDSMEEDFKSGESERQESAAEVLGALGGQGAPLLIDVIKQDKDIRTRQMAARLLSDMGHEAAQLVKRSLNVEVTVEQRFRVLEVIDLVTSDLRDELAYSLGDSNPKIRRAAFRLADRLNDDSLIDVLLPFASSEDPNIVKGAIRSLATLGSSAAVEAVAAALNDAKEPELATASATEVGSCAGDLKQHIKSFIGVTTKVEIVGEGEVPRSMGKAQRVIDKRNL